MVTSGDATSSPTRPANTDQSFSTRSASSPCPHASWKSTPPAPRLSTTGSFPTGAGRAPQHRERALGGGARHLLGVDLVEELEADAAPGRFHPGLHPGVADRDAVHEEPGAHGVVLDEQAVGVGHEDAAAGVGVADADLADRVVLGPGGLVGALEHFGLAGLLDRLRQDPDVVGAVRRRAVRARRRAIDRGCPGPPPRPPTPPRSARARSDPRCGRIRWCRRGRRGCPRRARDPRPAPRSWTSSRRAVATRRSSANTSAKSPPSRNAVCSVRSRTASSITCHLDP